MHSNDKRELSHTLCPALFLVALLVGAGSVAANPKPNDVRPGMSIDAATNVAIRCIQAASRMKTNDIRLQDSLAFVGINDEMRLDALKRHIVRNPNIGVPSVSGELRNPDLKFLILNDQLAAIETKWTVAKLAQTISEKAGIARLTYGRAASIIAACRGNTSPILANNVPADDPALPDAFVPCLVGKEKGVASAGVSDPTGRDYRYEIDADFLKDGIFARKWTWAELIEKTADNAWISNLPVFYGGGK